jgi:uncharacterized cupredoxin-like copper-binding protein
MMIRRSVVLTTVLAGVVLTGCTSATHRAGSPMMGGTGVSATNPHGGPTMDGGSGYHYSRLTCAAPNSLPGRVVNVTLADMGMTTMMGGTAPMGAHMMLRATPASVPAGKISLVASNMGWRTHELVVLPLAAGASAGQRVPGPDGKVDETGSLGEASGSCASGTGDGITAGTVGWTTLTLAPGRYELICNLTNHYADGMHQELVIT